MVEFVLSVLAGSVLFVLAAVIHDVARPRWRERRFRLGDSGKRRSCATWGKRPRAGD